MIIGPESLQLVSHRYCFCGRYRFRSRLLQLMQDFHQCPYEHVVAKGSKNEVTGNLI